MDNLQEERQDFVDHAIHALLCDLAGQELDWDIEFIGGVRDVIGREFAERDIMSEHEFYPWDEIKIQPDQDRAPENAGE